MALRPSAGLWLPAASLWSLGGTSVSRQGSEAAVSEWRRLPFPAFIAKGGNCCLLARPHLGDPTLYKTKYGTTAGLKK